MTGGAPVSSFGSACRMMAGLAGAEQAMYVAKL
jgi:hypothetical protein